MIIKRTSVRTVVLRAGGNSRPNAYQARILARYEAAKFQSVPLERINVFLHRDWLEGLTAAEAGVLISGLSDQKRLIKVTRRCRLIARKLGIKFKDIPLV